MKKIKRKKVSKDQLSWGGDLHPVLKRIYASRGVTSREGLERELKHLIPFQQLSHIEQAANLLAEAISQQKRILIVGDFDADGATSCALAIRALKAFGAKQVEYLVPNRFDFGYGLTPELVEVAKQQSPDLIITVDNGIANNDGVDAAKAAGISVLITDHHLPPEVLPNADVIVNPNLHEDVFPSKSLAGVGVIFYVMLALRSVLRDQQWFQKHSIAEPNMATFLDLVALGTVADVVPLDKNNRVLVYQGLRRIRAGHAAPGILSLLELSGRELKNLTATDLAFAVAPRLNAAGRMDDMSLGIECLLSESEMSARDMAASLDQLNQDRRAVEEEMKTQAFDDLSRMNFTLNKNLPRGLCFYDSAWHQGVIGILASRLKEKCHRPVVAFAKIDGGELKGSARSISGCHIRDVLADIDRQHPGMIKKFGGHAMAAGLTLLESQYDAFKQAFAQAVSRVLREEDLEEMIETDGELSSGDLSLQFAELLQAAGPWGQGFPEPIFDGKFRLLSQRLLGNKHLKMVVSPMNEHRPIDAIAFNVDVKRWPNDRCQWAHVTYRLDVNEYQGRRTPQLIVEELQTGS
ncbi:MAG: single-stranded-DNA-specific exonuclease RecJ [Gammaproteobacteria bacterium]